jgi:hypothetical protein
MKRTLIRSGALVLLLLLAVLMYNLGKGHVLLLDNNTLTAAGSEYRYLKAALVTVDGGEELELYGRGRDKVEVKGRRHRIVLKLPAGTVPAERTVTESFTLGNRQRMMLISLPALAGGAEDWLQLYTPPAP